LVSCKGHEEPSHEFTEPVRSVRVPDMSHDIFLPAKMWDIVTGAEFSKAVKLASNLTFAPIGVTLKEKSHGVLIAPELKYDFSQGGGELDLSKAIKGDRGTFRLKFDFDGFATIETRSSLKIFYVSKARKRKLDDQIFGSGCQNFFDIKSYINSVNDKTGIEVNVTRDRHVSMLGGHFIFSYTKDKQIFISQVTFTDSRRPDLFCEEVARR
jgi:hypothetical protein